VPGVHAREHGFFFSVNGRERMINVLAPAANAKTARPVHFFFFHRCRTGEVAHILVCCPFLDFSCSATRTASCFVCGRVDMCLCVSDSRFDTRDNRSCRNETLNKNFPRDCVSFLGDGKGKKKVVCVPGPGKKIIIFSDISVHVWHGLFVGNVRF
jgi:hypothetical protein